MSSPEIPLSLSPRQAAEGAVVTVPLPTGATRIRIPPADDGDLVRAQVNGREVLLRIRVTRGALSSGPARLGLLGIAAVVASAVFLATGLDDDGTSTGPSSGSSAYASSTSDPYAEATEAEETGDPYSEEPTPEETGDPRPRRRRTRGTPTRRTRSKTRTPRVLKSPTRTNPGPASTGPCRTPPRLRRSAVSTRSPARPPTPTTR
ncbi:hypothetical protein [Streptomyces sp. NBC_01185]|uniref:hypothetical protein n=1 Tax=Streptomyces sp. NBC_01185 TaxID=2903764 RepID=UPI00386C91AD|nr:hypothetical protein OG770_18040 [Streptomyces sp. NBC_01185]